VRLGHVPALDAIRGIAILLVLAVHADHAVPGGELGVDLFFVLSGFLITSLLLTEWDRDATFSLRSFYRRRAFRLLPALVVMLAVVSAAAVLTADDVGGQLVWVLYSLGYVINFTALLEEGIGNASLRHMWSLSQEEQFYLVWPVLLLLLLRAGLRPRVLAGLLGGTAAALLVYRGVLESNGVSVSFLLYAPDMRGVGLVLGCLAAVVFTGGLVRRVPGWLATASLVPAVLLIGLLDMGGNAFFIAARQSGELAIAATLSSLYPVTTTILAAVILRERIGRAHAVGIVVAGVAVALIAAGAAGSG